MIPQQASFLVDALLLLPFWLSLQTYFAFSSTFFAFSLARLARSAAFLFCSSSLCFFFSSRSFFRLSFSSFFLCSFSSISFSESALVSSLAQGRIFFGADVVAAVGSTRYLDISDSLLLCFLLSPVELEAPDPSDTFFADPEGVEVTIVAAFLSALPLVLSLTALPLEIVLVGWSFDLKEDPELVGVSALSTGVSGEKKDTSPIQTECSGQVGVLQGDIAQASICKNNQCQQTGHNPHLAEH